MTSFFSIISKTFRSVTEKSQILRSEKNNRNAEKLQTLNDKEQRIQQILCAEFQRSLTGSNQTGKSIKQMLMAEHLSVYRFSREPTRLANHLIGFLAPLKTLVNSRAGSGEQIECVRCAADISKY